MQVNQASLLSPNQMNLESALYPMLYGMIGPKPKGKRQRRTEKMVAGERRATFGSGQNLPIQEILSGMYLNNPVQKGLGFKTLNAQNLGDINQDVLLRSLFQNQDLVRQAMATQPVQGQWNYWNLPPGQRGGVFMNSDLAPWDLPNIRSYLNIASAGGSPAWSGMTYDFVDLNKIPANEQALWKIQGNPKPKANPQTKVAQSEQAFNESRAKYMGLYNQPGMAQGGPIGQGAWVVGELGPELFIALPSGQMNMVGEDGPERFIPAGQGYVVPNAALPPAMAQGQGPQSSKTGKEVPLMGSRATGGPIGGKNLETYSTWQPGEFEQPLGTEKGPQLNAMGQMQKSSPQLFQQAQQLATQKPMYTYDPEQINQQWQQEYYQPAMQRWQTQQVPWLKEQYARSGNALGNVMPRGIAQQTQQLQTGLESQRGMMLGAGRELGVTAGESAANRQLQGTQLLGNLVQQYRNTQLAQQQLAAQIQQAQANQALAESSLAWQMQRPFQITPMDLISTLYGRQTVENIVQPPVWEQKQGGSNWGGLIGGLAGAAGSIMGGIGGLASLGGGGGGLTTAGLATLNKF